MSWGERTCKHYMGCDHSPTILTCNGECDQYVEKAHEMNEFCWCRPEVKTQDNSRKVIVHNYDLAERVEGFKE